MFSKKYISLKRLLDIFFSMLALILVSPIFFLVIIILRFSRERNIFYMQLRIGRENKRFNIIKFATMLKDSPYIGNKMITVRDDPRITRVGKWLRISKINELPQILNVIRGDMSLVGPRPLISESFNKYRPEVQEIISRNRPGITGIGSLVFRDEEALVSAYIKLGKDPLEYYRLYIYPYKGKLEMWYHENKSIMIDFKIIFLTLWSILRPNSNLHYKVLSNLPEKPDSLKLEGIKSL